MQNLLLPIKKHRFLILLLLALFFSTFFWWRYFGSHGQIIGDAVQYHEAAVSLLEDGSFGLGGQLTMMREPGYSFFLFIIYKIFGVAPMAVRLIQVMLHFCLALMVYFLASRIFSRLSAKIAAFLVIIFPMFNILTSHLISEIFSAWLVCLFLCLFSLAMIKNSGYLYALVGLTLGFFILVKSAFILLPVAIFLFIVFFKFKVSWRDNLKKAFILILFFSLVVVPWLVRNYGHFGQLSLSSRSGNMIYTRALKNTYDFETTKKYVISALSGEYLVRRFIDANYNFENDYIKKSLLNEFIKKETGRTDSYDYGKIDIAMRKEGLSLIKEQPFKYLFFGLVEINNLNSPMIYYERHFSIFHDNIYSQTFLKMAAILLLRLGWLVFLALMVYGILRVVKKNPLAWPMILLILVINFTLFFLQGNPRFLIPVFPIYLMLAAYGLDILGKKYLKPANDKV